MQLTSRMKISPSLIEKLEKVTEDPKVVLAMDILNASLEKIISPQKSIFFFTKNEIFSIKVTKSK